MSSSRPALALHSPLLPCVFALEQALEQLNEKKKLLQAVMEKLAQLTETYDATVSEKNRLEAQVEQRRYHALMMRLTLMMTKR